MDRVSSAYKRRTQAIILALGFLAAAVLNADSIGIVTALSTNKAVRASLVALASQIPPTRDSSNLSGTPRSGESTGTLGGSQGSLLVPQAGPSSTRDSRDGQSDRDYQLDSLNRIRSTGTSARLDVAAYARRSSRDSPVLMAMD
jgi:hypothetical protein